MRASRFFGVLLIASCGQTASEAVPDASAPDASCNGGDCPSACAAAGGTLCAGQCVDVTSDPESCGLCEHACDLGVVCSQGTCTPSCAPPLTACGEHCADLENDPGHCGSCAEDCGASHLCAGGSCAAFCPLATPSAIGPGNISVGVGDVDGDGNVDVVSVAGVNELSTLHVYLGRGDGTFQSLASQPLEAAADSIQLADVNGDSRLDVALLTGSGDRSLSIYLNQGGGIFSWSGDFAAGVWSGDLALADLDGGGAPDAVIANSGGSQPDGSWVGNDVTVLFNDGHGSFGGALHLQSGVLPSSVAISDLDGDGALDIAATNDGDGATVGAGLNLFFGDGQGGFTAAQPIALEAGGGLAAADLDSDGRVDLAIAGGSAVLVMLNGGQRQFAAAVAYPSPFATDLAAGDMNGDGHVDLVLGGEGIAVLFNRGPGTFEPAAACAYPPDGGGYAAVSPHIAALRSDGVPDVVTVDDSSNAGNVYGWLQRSQ